MVPILDKGDRAELRRFDDDTAHPGPLYALLNKRRDLNLEGKVHDVRIQRGCGAFSDVFSGYCTLSNGIECKVAVKKLRAHIMEDRKFQKSLTKELYIWSKLRHPRILPLEGFYIEENNYPHLVSKWMENGASLKYLDAHPDTNMVSFIIGIAEGIQYLHSCDIVHSDIKPDNVLVSDSGEPLLCDFGVSRLLASSESFQCSSTATGALRGTLRYISMERLQGSDDISKESDVWAFGMTVFTLLTKRMPYHNIREDAKVLLHISSGRLPSWPEEIEAWSLQNQIIRRICKFCWKEKSVRPSMVAFISELRRLQLVMPEHHSSQSIVSEYRLLFLRGDEDLSARNNTSASNTATVPVSTERVMKRAQGSVSSVSARFTSNNVASNTRFFSRFKNSNPFRGATKKEVSIQKSLTKKELSDKIDRQIKEDSRESRKECKILLLGSAESGKSTIVKQMKIIYRDGFTPDELLVHRFTIYRNLLESAQAIVLAMRKLGLDPVVPSNHAHVDMILSYKFDLFSSIASPLPSVVETRLGAAVVVAAGEFGEEVAAAIDALWSDPIIPKIMDHSSEFYLMDSAGYFFNEVKRIGKSGYMPTETDVLRARQMSSGIVESRFTTDQLRIHMLDVGGRRSERKKWIHCFESVTSLIFCTALSEYDQVLLEDTGQNRMVESLVMFESVINSRWFLQTCVILFLNKIDVFKSKLPKVPLEKYFTEYTGGPDVQKATKFFLWRFMLLNRAKLRVYPHTTQAIDTGDIRLAFDSVQGTILNRLLVTELRYSELL